MKTLRPNKRAIRRALKQQREQHTVKVTPMIVSSAEKQIEEILKILRPNKTPLKTKLARFRKKAGGSNTISR